MKKKKNFIFKIFEFIANQQISLIFREILKKCFLKNSFFKKLKIFKFSIWLPFCLVQIPPIWTLIVQEGSLSDVLPTCLNFECHSSISSLTSLILLISPGISAFCSLSSLVSSQSPLQKIKKIKEFRNRAIIPYFQLLFFSLKNKKNTLK